MGTADVRFPGRADVLRLALLAALLGAWVLATVAVWLGRVSVPQQRLVEVGLMYGVPFVLLAAALLRRAAPARELILAAGVTVMVSTALVGGPAAARDPYLIGLVPGLAIVAWSVRRRPVLAFVGAFALASVYGSLEAYTGLSGGIAIDVPLIGLWLVAISRRFDARREPQGFSLGAAAIGIYLLVTLVAVIGATDSDFALRDFRTSGWHIAALIPIAYFGLPAVSLRRCAQAATVIALLGAAYATLRWAIGASATESDFSATHGNVVYNTVDGEAKVQGALTSGQDLGLWSAVLIPYLVACAISWRGFWRVVPALATPLCVVALLGSGQRAGVVSAAVGVTLVVIAHQMSRGFRGPRLGVTAGAIATVAVGAVVIFPQVVDTPAKVDRYRNILHPSQDDSFQRRLYKWDDAFRDVEGHPFGRGIGQAGIYARGQRVISVVGLDVDNSYVKVAYEQGTMVMLLFIAGLLVLLLELLRFGVWTRAPEGAAATIGAAGALSALGVEYIANVFILSLASATVWLVVGLGLAHVVTLRRA